MLSEFYHVGLQLAAAGIKTSEVSSKICGCPKNSTAVLVTLKKDGSIAKLSIVDCKERYRKYAKSNHAHMFILNYDYCNHVFRQKINACVEAFLEDIGSIPHQYACISDLCDALLKFDAGLSVAADSKKKDDKKTWPQLETFLEQHKIERKKENPVVSVVFDLHRNDDLYTDRTWDWINEQLLQTSASCKAAVPFGTVLLRSMNADAPCNKRYGSAGDESFALSSQLQQQAKNGLEWITNKDRRGKTWQWLNNRSVLISYAECDVIKSQSIKLPNLFSEQEKAEIAFQESAEELINAISKHIVPPNPLFRWVIIAPAKKANARVIGGGCFDLSKLVESINAWQDGCRNVPGQPSIPFPFDCFKHIVNKKWHRDVGKIGSNDVVGLSVTDIYELFYQKTSCTAIIQLLATLVTNWRCYIFAKARGKKGEWLLSLMGLLLFRLGIKKETYMQDEPYLLGRYLSLLDGLHKCYCEVVRDGSFPSYFIGSESLQAMSLSPLRTFGNLGKRTRVYVGWAKTYTGEKAKLAKWFLKEISDVVGELKEIPTTFDKTQQAQFMIGFMGSNSSNSSKETM